VLAVLEFACFSCQYANSISNWLYSYLIGLLAYIDRGRYLKVETGGSHWGEDEGRAWSGYRRGSPPSTRRLGGFTPGFFWKFYVQSGAFGGKIALCFDYKQTAILTQTFGHKWFSELE